MAEINLSSTITVDLHGMNRYQAKIALDSALKKNRYVYKIRVIHGYHGGSSLSDLVRSEYARHPAVKRVQAVSDGATDLILRDL